VKLQWVFLKASVGVFGATGYSGREAVRLLRGHPHAAVAFTTGSAEGHVPHEKGLEQAADAYLLSLPHGVSATYVARLRAARLIRTPSSWISPATCACRAPRPTRRGTATSILPRNCSGRRPTA
jgi:hypothetical protein